jgi:hypothetical protein
MKIRPVGAKFCANSRTDRHDRQSLFTILQTWLKAPFTCNIVSAEAYNSNTNDNSRRTELTLKQNLSSAAII